jgi:ribosomal-protein-alanine N-acetyltransferase
LCGFLITVLIPPQAELETIAVAKHTHRQGIATRLLTELLSMLQKKQITEVMLEVRQSNYAARGFYDSAGFAETGRRTGYYSDPKEDAILLSRPVKGTPPGRKSPESE